jgi:glyoxylase I family protein
VVRGDARLRDRLQLGRSFFRESRERIITAEGARAAQTLKTPGLRHLAIAVSDFDAAYGRLKDKAVSFVAEPADSQGTKTVFFTDPEGNYLHLIQRPAPLG